MLSGTLAAHGIRRLIETGAIESQVAIGPQAVQPASLDLSLGEDCWRMPGSMLPLAGEQVSTLIDSLALQRIDLAHGACLARGHAYLVRLRERFALPAGLEAYANSKSSTGRIDLSTRVLVDGCPRYDRIPAGYHGELWLELIPRSFDIVARSGDSLNQVIFFHNRLLLDAQTLRQRHVAEPLLFAGDGSVIPACTAIHDAHVAMTADLSTEIVGWVACRGSRPLVLSTLRAHEARDFFAAIHRPASGLLFLEKGRFYILATCERVRVPADLACEMIPFDPTAGEFRAHYAGFFDPGWGAASAQGRGGRAVLEVRPHEDDLIIRHGQPICAMAYERLAEPCTELYGSSGSNYAEQDGPQLSKHFILS